jgi:hypothetical protein
MLSWHCRICILPNADDCFLIFHKIGTASGFDFEVISHISILLAWLDPYKILSKLKPGRKKANLCHMAEKKLKVGFSLKKKVR